MVSRLVRPRINETRMEEKISWVSQLYMGKGFKGMGKAFIHTWLIGI